MTTIEWLLLLPCVLGYKHFQDQIPNGDNVPHPCKPNYMWQGVGHQNVDGGGIRNPFGKAFNDNGKVWNECLCRHDSDADGRSNGEELGDPDCIWQPGDVPARVTELSHPGVCEPVEHPKCIELNSDWLDCENVGFQCDPINENGVRSLSLVIPRTTVPAKETSYYCMNFEMLADQDYHIVATKPIVDNNYVLHHIVMFGCDETFSNEAKAHYSTPQPCDMVSDGCMNIMSLWTVGRPGECLPTNVGHKVGKNGVKFFMLQFHWNNPKEVVDYTDASGLLIYYTPHLRVFDAGVLTVGSMSINIPPYLNSYLQNGYCHSECSENFQGEVRYTEVLFHMHYLGRAAKLEHFRNGQKIFEVVQEDYAYDNPEPIVLPHAVVFQPGDDLVLSCTYRSSSKTDYIVFGDGTSNEMCFAFINFYPASSVNAICVSYRTVPVCLGEDITYQGCDLNNFMQTAEFASMMMSLGFNCGQGVTCTGGCQGAIDTAYSHTCFQGDLKYFMHFALVKFGGSQGQQALEWLTRCDSPESSAVTAPVQPIQTEAPTGPIAGETCDLTHVLPVVNAGDRYVWEQTSERGKAVRPTAPEMERVTEATTDTTQVDFTTAQMKESNAVSCTVNMYHLLTAVVFSCAYY